MQKLESSLKNMVLVLVGVALIVGAVLAYINHLTSGPPYFLAGFSPKRFGLTYVLIRGVNAFMIRMANDIPSG